MDQEPRVEGVQDKSVLSNLKEEWVTFLSVIFGPNVLVLFGITVVLMVLHLRTPTGSNIPAEIEVALTIIIAISSTILGGVVSQRWSKVKETSILVTRGKSAIRGLTLLSNNVLSLDRRLKRYQLHLSELVSDEGVDQLRTIRMSYEEVIERCNLLQEEAINAIEEWQDIIPEVANLKTKIGVITNLKNEQIVLLSEIRKHKEELEKTREQSEEEKENSSEKLKVLEGQLARVREELSKATPWLLPSASTGAMVLGGPTGFSELLNTTKGYLSLTIGGENREVE